MTGFLKYWKPVAVVIVLMALSWSLWQQREQAEEEGRLKGRIAGLEVERDSLTKVKETRDTAYRVDTLEVRRTETRFRTLRDSVLVRLTDTVLVREALAAGDSTIRACRQALTTCEQRVADRDRLITNERATRAAADSLWRVRLARTRPRLLPYVEAGVDPINGMTWTARGGAEIRVLGPVRLVGALELSAAPTTSPRALLGARWTF